LTIFVYADLTLSDLLSAHAEKVVGATKQLMAFCLNSANACLLSRRADFFTAMKLLNKAESFIARVCQWIDRSSTK
jgi:hypothetical protein